MQLHAPARRRANGDGEAARPTTATRCWARIPTRSEEITLRSGRFGPYVQRGDGKEAKRSSLPKGWTADAIDHEKALALLSLPRDVGKHPESGKMISAGLGRYGPFVLHDGTYANLDSVEDVFSIGLNRAVSVIAEKQSEGPRRRDGGTPAALKALGDASGRRRRSRCATANTGPMSTTARSTRRCPRARTRCR